MNELTTIQLGEIIRLASHVLPNAEYAPEESWDGNKSYEFNDSCGCYSEWTQEPCRLLVWLKGDLAGKGFEQAMEIEQALRKWAAAYLEWDGCECCGYDLSISVRLFPALKGER